MNATATTAASRSEASGLFSDLERRGIVYQVTDAGLGDRLSREHLTFYCGFDPTAPSLHAGHLLQLLTVRRLWLAGHPAVALVGGATALVGDPSGRQTDRVLLSRDEVYENASAVRAQIEQVLGAEKASNLTVVNNLDWHGGVDVLTYLRDVGRHFNVATMLAKDSVRERLEGREHGLSFTEFAYMTLQARDFWQLNHDFGCTLQIGGSDQWGNITAGIDYIRRVEGRQVYGMTTPLLTREDGEKFGKSAGNAVWLDPEMTSPFDFYQFWLRTPDADAVRYLRLFTFRPLEEIDALEAAMAADPEAREPQRALAWDLTGLVHGREQAEHARRTAETLYGDRVRSGDLSGLDEAALVELAGHAPAAAWERSRLDGDGIGLVEALTGAGLSESNGAARRQIAQGGVYVNQLRETDADRRLRASDLLLDRYLLLRRGRKTYRLITFE